jgi:hypothetical protein
MPNLESVFPRVGNSVLFSPGALIPSLAGKGPFAAIVVGVSADAASADVVFFTNGATNFATAKAFWRGGQRPNKDTPYCQPVEGEITP